jgi:hypothetical protein
MFTTRDAGTRRYRRATGLLALLVALAAALFSVSLTTASAKPRTATPDQIRIVQDQIDGVFDVNRFKVEDGQIFAVGTFTGTVTDAAGNVASGTETNVELPVNLAQSSGSCEILDLVLGPLNLELLGLQVHLDQVHLNITAQSGPGNLLGNLLCAIAHLLDGPTVEGLLNQIVNLLNQILGALR